MGTRANSYGLKQTAPSILLTFLRLLRILLPALFDCKNISRLWGIQILQRLLSHPDWGGTPFISGKYLPQKARF